MALRELEKVGANIVLLSGADVSLSLNPQDLAPILKDAAVEMAAPPLQGLRIVSLREQVIVTIGGGQFVFEDQSDAVPPKPKLAEIVQAFVQLLSSKGAQFRAYGFNFSVTFDAPGDAAAAEVARDRYIKVDSVERRGSISLQGAGVTLYFEMGNAHCNLAIEPKEHKLNTPHFFSRMNCHYDLPEAGFPAAGELRSDFSGKWGVYTDLLERLLTQP